MALKARIVKRATNDWIVSDSQAKARMAADNLRTSNQQKTGNSLIGSTSLANSMQAKTGVTAGYHGQLNNARLSLETQQRENQQRSSLQSHRYKPYETARKTSSQIRHSQVIPTTSTASSIRNNNPIPMPGSSQIVSSLASMDIGLLHSSSVSENVPAFAFKKPSPTPVSLNSQILNKKIPSPPQRQQFVVERQKAGQPMVVIPSPGSAGTISGGISRGGSVAEASKPPQQQPVVDLNKSFLNASVSNKPNRTAAVVRRRQQEQLVNHLKEVVEVQEILYSLSRQGKERQDFLQGVEGAPKLTAAELVTIEIFQQLVSSGKRPTSAIEIRDSFSSNWKEPSQEKASNHFKLLMEGRNEKADGTNVSYMEGRMILQRVIRSCYFYRRRYSNLKTEVL